MHCFYILYEVVNGGCRGKFVIVEHREEIRNIVILKKDNLILPRGVGKSLIFQSCPLEFYSWHGATESFIVFFSLINTLKRNQTVAQRQLSYGPPVTAVSYFRAINSREHFDFIHDLFVFKQMIQKPFSRIIFLICITI